MNENPADPRFPGSGNYLDWLMELDPLELSAQNIDDIIAYQRKARANHEAGVKPKKSDTAAKIDLNVIGLVTTEAPIKRRKL